jgi:hypothetical protein
MGHRDAITARLERTITPAAGLVIAPNPMYRHKRSAWPLEVP